MGIVCFIMDMAGANIWTVSDNVDHRASDDEGPMKEEKQLQVN